MSCDEANKVADTNSTETTLKFERNCVNDRDCHYENEKARGQVHLTCKEGTCQCQNPSVPVQDVPNYSVRVLNNECVVRSNAPCGTTNGITLECEDGKFCIEGRCRSQIRTRAKYFLCDEDIDCEEGLKCIEKKVPPIVSYCRDPIPPTLTFERECTRDNDCQYKNKKARDTVYLSCKEGKCQCQNRGGIPVQDVPIYSVRVLNDVCIVYDGYGPCGTADGITLVCEDDKFCIEGRCRKEIRSATKNFYCDEDIDCQEGLKCVPDVDSFPILFYCQEE